MNTNEAEKYNPILELAVLSENSCDASMKMMGRAVTGLFPESIVTKTKQKKLWNGQ